MKKTPESGPTADPFEIWRQQYDANERAWSAALEQAMDSPEFGESSARLLETMLAAQKSIRASFVSLRVTRRKIGMKLFSPTPDGVGLSVARRKL